MIYEKEVKRDVLFSSIQKEERKIRMNINDVFQARKTKKFFFLVKTL